MQQEKTFDSGHAKLNYLDCGPACGTPLVMLHGGAWRWQEFLSLIPTLSRDRRVCAVDFRGNGKSGWAERYRLEDFSADIAEFVGSLEGPAILLGHSLGGAVAFMVAARDPQKIKALIIEDAPLTVTNYRQVVESSREMYGVWLDLKRSAQSEQDLGRALAKKYQDYPGITSEWILFFAGCLWQLDPAFFEALLYDFDGFVKGYLPQEFLTRLSCPILFLRGEPALGAVMMDDEVLWLKDRFPNVTCAQIKGVGHLLHLQDQGQAAVLTEVASFLRGI